jgi:hypothetical protein
MLAILVPLLVSSGCATGYGAQQSDGWAEQASAAPSPETGPRLVLPATGGAPVMAIPLGGGVYLPVTGEPPVVATPLTP